MTIRKSEIKRLRELRQRPPQAACPKCGAPMYEPILCTKCRTEQQQGKETENRKLQSLLRQIEGTFSVTCSVMAACTGRNSVDWEDCNNALDVAKKMIVDGWLDDLIVEDSINLACPACVAYLKENRDEFQTLDERVGE